MKKSDKKAETNKPLTLKEWVYDTNGKPLKILVNDSFINFYFAKKIAESRINA